MSRVAGRSSGILVSGGDGFRTGLHPFMLPCRQVEACQPFRPAVLAASCISPFPLSDRRASSGEERHPPAGKTKRPAGCSFPGRPGTVFPGDTESPVFPHGWTPAEKRDFRSVVVFHSELSDNPLEGIGFPDFKLPVILLVDVVDVKLLLVVHLRFTSHSYVLHRAVPCRRDCL